MSSGAWLKGISRSTERSVNSPSRRIDQHLQDDGRIDENDSRGRRRRETFDRQASGGKGKLVPIPGRMAGYGGFEEMSLADAYVNAAMILSGMGPLGELKPTAGTIFAGSYAIFSGLVLVVATAFVLAPIFHRVSHRFHVETGQED